MALQSLKNAWRRAMTYIKGEHIALRAPIASEAPLGDRRRSDLEIERANERFTIEKNHFLSKENLEKLRREEEEEEQKKQAAAKAAA
jgi:hypothetical protein